MRVLIVEDDAKTAEYLRIGLQQEGFSAECAVDGDEGLFLASRESFDAIVMDIMLPKCDGLSVIRRLRQQSVHTPVLILSAKGSVDERVEGLRIGGDDYLAKPFSFAELIARLESLVRRACRVSPTSVLTVGGVSADRRRYTVFVGANEVLLQPKEFRLLVYLMENSGRVLSKSMILDRVWDVNFDPQTNVVEARISKIRSKLASYGVGHRIQTVRGLGYRFDDRDD